MFYIHFTNVYKPYDLAKEKKNRSSENNKKQQ